MLSEFLQSSYKTYKEDTNVVVNWLANKAKQCGYSADLLSQSENDTKPSQAAPNTGRLKGAARKKSKAASQNFSSPQVRHGDNTDTGPAYVIDVRDFITLAKFVTSSKNPIVQAPKAFVVALNRAIALRRAHYVARSQADRNALDQSTSADNRHAHFLNILEQTRDILEPCFQREYSSNSLRSSTFSDKENAAPTAQVDDNLVNRFDGLEVEQPSQGFLDAPDVERAQPKLGEDQGRYRADIPHSTEEEFLATSCLLEDIMQIRYAVRQLWQHYSEGMSLVSVSIATNTAISLVRDLETDYMKQFPNSTDYQSITMVVWAWRCISLGHDPGAREQQADPFNLAAYDVAEDIMMPTYSSLLSLQDLMQEGTVPLYKPGHFGRRDRGKKWADKTPREKLKDDQLVLFEAFSDLVLLAMITEKAPLAEDDLIRGIRAMKPGKAIPLWLVFAAQCFLDIQRVLDKGLARPHVELQYYGKTVTGTIEKTLDYHGKLRIDNWPKHYDSQFHEQLRVIKQWISNDMIAIKWRKHNSQSLDLDIAPFRLLKQYPLMCGLFLYSLQMEAQMVSTSFINAWGSVLYACHLYVAGRQQKLILEPWKDMELVIILQGTERLFIGDRPTGLEEYFKRWSMSMGWSATNFAKNRRSTKPTMSPRGPRSLAQLCAIGLQFVGRYSRNEATVNWTPETLKEIIEGKFDSDEEHDGSIPATKASSKDPKNNGKKVKSSSTGALLSKRKHNPGTLIPTVEFLSDLANALNAETMEMNLDYLLLHRRCWDLLRSVNENCKPKLLQYFGPGYLEKENQLPFVVGYIFMVATRTATVQNILKKKREGVEVNSALLVAASSEMDMMIVDGEGEMATRLCEMRMGAPIDFGGLNERAPNAAAA